MKKKSESLGGSDFFVYLCPVHCDAHTFLFAQSPVESPPRKGLKGQFNTELKYAYKRGLLLSVLGLVVSLTGVW